jgi:hypothetical protein
MSPLSASARLFAAPVRTGAATMCVGAIATTTRTITTGTTSPGRSVVRS